MSLKRRQRVDVGGGGEERQGVYLTAGGGPITRLWNPASEITGREPEPEPGAVTTTVSREVVP